MTAVTVKVNITGAPDTQDKATMRYLVDQENLRRLQINTQIALANAQPGATQQNTFAILSNAPADLKTSAETILSDQAMNVYKQIVEQQEQFEIQAGSFKDVKTAFAQQTDPTKRAAAIAAFKAALA